MYDLSACVASQLQYRIDKSDLDTVKYRAAVHSITYDSHHHDICGLKYVSVPDFYSSRRWVRCSKGMKLAATLDASARSGPGNNHGEISRPWPSLV